MKKINDILAQMQAAGLSFERGTPATEREVAALQAAAGHRFPAGYTAFLREFGWLRAGRCVVFGASPGDVGIDAASVEVEMEFSLWEQPTVDVTPLIAQTNLFPQQCVVVDAAGRMQSFRRGRLEPLECSFEKEVEAALASELERHVRETGAAAFRAEVMAAIRDRIPTELLAGESSECRLLVRQPGGGSAIEIRFGNGQEYGGKAPGIFVRWTQPSSRGPESMNEFNRKACLVRGCVQHGFDDRYRACLPADVASVGTLVKALAIDAGLPIAVEGALEPSLDQIAAKLPASPVAPEKMLLMAMLGQEPEPPVVERAGDMLLISVAGMSNKKAKHAVRIRSAGHGLVEVSHVLSAALPWPQINALNGASTDPGAPDHDDEPMIRAVAGEAATVLSFMTTLTGLTNGAYTHDLTKLLYLADQGLPGPA